MLASADSTIRLWQGDPEGIKDEWKAPFNAVNALAFCHNSRTLLVGGNSQNLFKIDVVTKETDYFKLEESSVKSMCTSFDQSKVAIGHGSGKVTLLTAIPLVVNKTYTPCKMSVTSLAFTKDSTGIYSSDIHGHISLLTRNQVEIISKPNLEAGSVNCMSTSRFHDDLAVFCGKSVSLYNTETKKYINQFSLGGRGRGAFLPTDANQILCSSDNGAISMIDTRSSKLSVIADSLQSMITGISIHPNGNLYAISYFDGGIEVRDIRNSKYVVEYSTNRVFGPSIIAYQPSELSRPHQIERAVSNTTIPVADGLYGTPLADKSNARSFSILKVPVKHSEHSSTDQIEEEEVLNFSFLNPVSSPAARFRTPRSTLKVSAAPSSMNVKTTEVKASAIRSDALLEKLDAFQSVLDQMRSDFNQRLRSIESRLERLESK